MGGAVNISPTCPRMALYRIATVFLASPYTYGLNSAIQPSPPDRVFSLTDLQFFVRFVFTPRTRCPVSKQPWSMNFSDIPYTWIPLEPAEFFPGPEPWLQPFSMPTCAAGKRAAKAMTFLAHDDEAGDWGSDDPAHIRWELMCFDKVTSGAALLYAGQQDMTLHEDEPGFVMRASQDGTNEICKYWKSSGESGQALRVPTGPKEEPFVCTVEYSRSAEESHFRGPAKKGKGAEDEKFTFNAEYFKKKTTSDLRITAKHVRAPSPTPRSRSPSYLLFFCACVGAVGGGDQS